MQTIIPVYSFDGREDGTLCEVDSPPPCYTLLAMMLTVKQHECVGFELLTAVTVESTDLWVITLCSFLEKSRHF
jgi:hypothetical protein